MHVTVRSDAKISLKGEGNMVVLSKEDGGTITFACPNGNINLNYEEGEVLHKSRIPYESEFMYQARIESSAAIELNYDGNLEGWVHILEEAQ